MIDFINKEMYNVVLSIDGRKEVNDRMRVRVDGSGSYDRIIPNFKKLVEKRPKNKDWYVRGTYTKYNLDFSNDVMHLYDLGFDQISVEPVMADPSEPYAITEADLPRIFKEYEILSEKIQKIRDEGKFINFFICTNSDDNYHHGCFSTTKLVNNAQTSGAKFDFH